MTDWQRLEQVIRWTGLSTNAFAKGIGLKRSENLYQIKRGNNGISKELAELIARRYPTISAGWLLTGGGSMISSISGVGGGRLRPVATIEEPHGVPYYNIDISRLSDENGIDGLRPLYYIDVPSFGQYDFAVTSSGNAMAPHIPAGALVALREVAADAFLPGEAYVVVTSDFAALRYVRNTPAPGNSVALIPANLDDFDEVMIGRDRIRKLYMVKGVIVNKVL